MHKKSSPLLILGVFGVIAIGGGAAYVASFSNRIFPHVRVGAIEVGNLSPASAAQVLTPQLKYANLQFTWGTSQWQIPSSRFGLHFDPAASAARAFAVGHGSALDQALPEQLQAWRAGVQVDPVFSLDPVRTTAALAPIFSQINVPSAEPQIQLQNGHVLIQPGENGQAVDEADLQKRIHQTIASLKSNPVEVPVRKIEPKLSDAQVQQLQTQAEKLLGKKINLTFEDQHWDINQEQIISWIDLRSSGSVLSWNKSAIKTWATELAQNIDRPAQDAHFRYLGAGRVEEFAPAKDGVAVQQDNLVANLVTSLNDLQGATPSTALAIPTNLTRPTVTTDQVNNLGIKELIARGESNYTGSIPNRIFNLHKAANSMNGVLVAPGEEFSFDKYVGDISAAGGYKQAYVIKQGRTVLGDGGGVCQVSTTMFRAALNAGLPITARTAHAYRVHYYENDSQPGLDATIFTPSVDFRFKNDTSGYILIQTVFDDAHLKMAFELYGTKDGREVTLSKSRVWDVTPPPPALYQDDPSLPSGVVQQVDFPAWGAKAAFDYKVTRNGEILEQQTFYSNYQPWQAVYLRGTKV